MVKHKAIKHGEPTNDKMSKTTSVKTSNNLNHDNIDLVTPESSLCLYDSDESDELMKTEVSDLKAELIDEQPEPPEVPGANFRSVLCVLCRRW